MDLGIIEILEKYGWMTAVVFFIGYLIKKMIDKDPYKFFSKITSLFKRNVENNEDEILVIRQERHNNELKAYEITKYTRKERLVRYKQLREDVTVITFLNRWKRVLELDSTFDVFRFDDSHTEKDINKRIWNAKLWLTHKINTFAFGLDKILDDFENHYVEFNETKYYNYLSFENWENIILGGVQEYTDKCKNDRINVDFLKMITDNHNSSIQYVLDSVKKTLNIKIYNDDPIIIIEVIFTAFHNAFNEAFSHIDDMLKMNGELTHILEQWDIPIKTDNDILNESIAEINFNESTAQFKSSFIIDEDLRYER